MSTNGFDLNPVISTRTKAGKTGFYDLFLGFYFLKVLKGFFRFLPRDAL